MVTAARARGSVRPSGSARPRGNARPSGREDVVALEDVPNVGKAMAGDFRRLGIDTPRALVGRDPYALYDALNRATGQRHDPCVLDTFIAAVRFMEGAPARPWWHYTAERKRVLATAAKPAAQVTAKTPAKTAPKSAVKPAPRAKTNTAAPAAPAARRRTRSHPD